MLNIFPQGGTELVPKAGKVSGKPPLRSRIRRWLLWSIFGCLILLGTVILLRNPIARWLLPHFLGPVLGLQIEVGQVHIGWQGDLQVHDLIGCKPVAGTAVREFTLRKVSLDLRPLDLFSDPLAAIESLTIAGDSLTLALDQPPGKSAPPPTPGKGAFAWPEKLPPVTINWKHLEIRSGENKLKLIDTILQSDSVPMGSPFQFQTQCNWQLPQENGVASLDLTGYYGNGTLTELASSFAGQPWLAEGRVDLVEQNLNLPVTLAGGSGRIALAMAGSGNLTGKVELVEVDLARLSRFTQALPVQGKASLKGDITLPLSDPLSSRAELSFFINNGSYQGIPIKGLRITSNLANKRLQLTTLEAEGLGIRIKGFGLTANLAHPGKDTMLDSLAGELELAAADLGPLMTSFPPGSIPKGLVQGTALQARLGLSGRQVRLAGGALAGADFRLDLKQGSCLLSLTDLLASPLALTGHLKLPRVEGLTGKLPLPGVEVGGSLAFTFSLAGTLAEPLFQATIAGQELFYKEVKLGDLRARVKASMKQVDLLSFDLGEAGKSPLALKLKGGLDLTGAGLTGMAVDLQVAPSLSRRFLSAKTAALLPPGNLHLTGQLQGRPDWPDGEISLIGESNTQPQTKIFYLEKTGEKVDIRIKDLPISAFNLSCSATCEISSDLERGEFKLGNLAVSKGTECWATAGLTRFTADLTQGRFTINPPLVMNNKGALVSIGLHPRKGIENYPVHLVEVTANLPGQLPFGLQIKDMTLENSSLTLHSTTKLDGTFPDELALLVKTDFVRPDIKGSLTGQANLNGKQARLELFLPAITLSAIPCGSALHVPMQGTGALKATWDGKQIQLAECKLGLEELELSGQGSADFSFSPSAIAPTVPGLPTNLDLSFKAAVSELFRCKRFLPQVQGLGGKANLAGRIKGSLLAPEVEADLVVANAHLRFDGIPVLSELAARLRLSGEEMVCSHVRGELGGAPFLLTGKVGNLIAEPQVDFTLQGENILVARNQSLLMRANTAIALTGPLKAMKVKGDVSITDGRIYQQIPTLDLGGLLRRLGQVKRIGTIGGGRGGVASHGAGLKLFQLANPPLSDLEFLINITQQQPITLMGNIIKGKLRPDFKLCGRGAVPFLVGTINLDECTLFLPATELKVDSGYIRFNPKAPMFPELQLTGVTRMAGYDISVSMSGPINGPSVVFSSSPPLPTDDLVLLVATGRVPRDNSRQAAGQALFTVAKYFGMDLLGKLFGAGVASEKNILDRFELEIGRDISQSGQSTIEARFRLRSNVLTGKDTLYLVGERDEYDHANLGIRLVIHGQ